MTDKSRLAALATAMSAWMAEAMRARSMQLTAATLTAAILVVLALLAGTSDAARKKQGFGQREFFTQTTCGSGAGKIYWQEGSILVEGNVWDYDSHPNSKTHLFVNWKDDKRNKPKSDDKPIVTAHNSQTGKNNQGKPFGPVPVPGGVKGKPRDAEVTACSDSCGKRWACGRPG
jgi:hypothetical protein